VLRYASPQSLFTMLEGIPFLAIPNRRGILLEHSRMAAKRRSLQVPSNHV
jgi:hypothetical protein